jgi:DNA-binding response OmpR family regulator
MMNADTDAGAVQDDRLSAHMDQTSVHTYVLLVEDESSIASFIRRGLIFEGFEVDVAADGHRALDMIRERPPDVLVLDRMLPGVDGIEIARRLRAAEQVDDKGRLPIIMLTAKETVQDRILGLDAGADDYLVKPFDFNELLARIRALLRRSAAQSPTTSAGEVLTYSNVRMDLGSRVVHRGDREIELTPREFDLLVLFMRNPNQVLTRSMLMQRVWGEDFFGESNVLEVVVGNVRRSLEDGGEPRLIQTVRGIGYVLRQR